MLAATVLCLSPALAQRSTEPPEDSCPEGTYYHPREDECLPLGTPPPHPITEVPRFPPRPARRPAGDDGISSRAVGECVLQYLDKAHKEYAARLVLRACRVLHPGHGGGGR